MGCPRARASDRGAASASLTTRLNRSGQPAPRGSAPAGMSIMQSSQLGRLRPRAAVAGPRDHSLLQNGSDIHHYARAHLPVKYSRRSRSRSSRGAASSRRRAGSSRSLSLGICGRALVLRHSLGFRILLAVAIAKTTVRGLGRSGRSSRLDPNSSDYVASAPMEWGFDGHHLGPGSRMH